MYQFRLQRVLDYRHQLTKNVERELHEMMQRLQQDEVILEQCRVEARSCAHYLDQWQGHTVRSDELKMVHRAYCDHLDRIEQQERIVRQAASNIVDKRQELVRAKQGEQVLEKLKEQGSRRYAAERAVDEQRMFDELIILRGNDERNSSPAKDLT